MADTATTGAAAAAQINEPLIRVEGLHIVFGKFYNKNCIIGD